MEYQTPEEVGEREGVSPITVRVACRQYRESGGRLGLKAEKSREVVTAPWCIRSACRRGPGNPRFGTQQFIVKMQAKRLATAMARQGKAGG